MKRLGEILYLTVITSAILFSMLVMSGCAQPSNGTNGAVGLTGQRGLPGLDATLVKVINLCPGASAYPKVFVESALCIDHKLYGVYSLEGGFLSELPVGSYKSLAIGSACNFKVLTDCVVQPL